MALTQNKLNELLASFVKNFKEYDSLLRKFYNEKRAFFQGAKYASSSAFDKPKPMPPEYYPGYRATVEMMEQIEVHADKNIFPANLFISKAPNETPEEKAYRRANYKNTTMPVFVDFINTLNRCTADQNWSFSTSDERLLNYIEHGAQKFGGMEGLLKNFIPQLKTKDANGIIAIEPKEIPLRKDAEGNLILDESGSAIVSDDAMEVEPVYYSSRDVIGRENGEYFMVIAKEKTEISVNGKQINDGVVLYIFDDENIYESRQYGKLIDYSFTEFAVKYHHGLGKVNAAVFGGIPAIYEGRIFYISPFSSAADLLDLCLLDESNLFVIKATTVYNYKVAIGTPCTFQRDGHACNDGQIFNTHANGGVGADEDCPACLGAGLRPRMSPFGVLLINPGVSTSTNPEGDSKISGDYLKLIAPPVEAPKLLREEIEKNEKRARKIMHIPDADSAVSGEEASTATGSLNKARALYAFIQPQASQIFAMYEYLLDCANRMMFTSPEPFTLIPAKTYDLLTPADQLAVIAELSNSGLPPALITSHIEQYLGSVMYANRDIEAAFKLIMQEDVLLAMTRDDINLRLTAGKIEPWRDTLHQSGLQLIKQLFDANDGFFRQDYTEQAAQLIAFAKENTIAPQADPRLAAEEQLRRIAAQTV